MNSSHAWDEWWVTYRNRGSCKRRARSPQSYDCFLHSQSSNDGVGYIRPYSGKVILLILKILFGTNTMDTSKDLFDAAYNYFPITFRPPPNDPYGVTAQDLKDRLQACITSTSLFAPYSFPALLDKLDSTSANVKVRFNISIQFFPWSKLTYFLSGML